MLDIAEEALTAGQAIALFREIIEDPDMGEGVFYNMTTKEIIVAVEQEEGKERRYARADIVRIANERKELAFLLSANQVVDIAAVRGITLKFKEIDRMVESGRLPVAKRLGRLRYFRPEDVDDVIASLIDFNVLKEQTKDLLETVDAVRWINARLEEQGREDRVKLDTFYHWVSDERRGILLQPDYRLPCGQGKKAMTRYYFSEKTLQKAPIFQVPPLMPSDVEPISLSTEERLVTTPQGSYVEAWPEEKKLQELQLQWGDVVTRQEIIKRGLSVHATTAKKKEPRRVKHVAEDSIKTKYFPARHIPKKQRRRTTEEVQAKKALQSRTVKESSAERIKARLEQSGTDKEG